MKFRGLILEDIWSWIWIWSPDLDLDLDLNLGQWLSRPVWCKFQCGKDDTLIMKFRGLILDEIWSWIWIWRWIWSWIWSWILIWTLIWTCI